MKTLAAVLTIVVGSFACSTTERASSPRRPSSARLSARADSKSKPPVKKKATATTSTSTPKKKKSKPEVPARSPIEESPALEPVRYEGIFAGSMNEQMYLESVQAPLVLDEPSRQRIARAKRGDRVTVLLTPGKLAQVVDVRENNEPEPSAAVPALIEGLVKGDRVSLRLTGSSWVSGEVLALQPRLVLDFSHEPKSYVGQCSYDLSSIVELRHIAALDPSERIGNRLANGRSHAVAEAPNPRARRARPVAAAHPRARSSAR